MILNGYRSAGHYAIHFINRTLFFGSVAMMAWSLAAFSWLAFNYDPPSIDYTRFEALEPINGQPFSVHCASGVVYIGDQDGARLPLHTLDGGHLTASPRLQAACGPQVTSLSPEDFLPFKLPFKGDRSLEAKAPSTPACQPVAKNHTACLEGTAGLPIHDGCNPQPSRAALCNG